MQASISLNLRRIVAPLIITAGLIGCGDGSGPESIAGTPLPPPPAVTGILVDSAVEGVSFMSTSGESGVTNSLGEFTYLPGDSVTFSIGGITLGSPAGAPIITSVELTGSSDPNAQITMNQLVFLQSLDSDADPSNGITISADTVNLAQGQSLNFASPDFSSQVQTVVAAITEPDNTVVSETEALLHFYDTYLQLGGTDALNFLFPGFPPVGGGEAFRLVFSDEFNAGDAPAADKWTLETGYGPRNDGWGNNEWQLYTTSPDNVRVEDGNLVIQARCDTPPCGSRDGTVTSGKINSLNKFNFRYGKVLARIKPPVGDGAWPAFWSLGANHPQVGWPRSGEIDFMEMHNAFSNERTTHFTVHWCDQTIQAPATCSFPDGWMFDSQNREFDESLGDDFHVFEADWNEDRIIGKIDGITYFERAIDATTMEEFLREFYMILNVAMGGTLGSDNQPPNGNEVWPQTMLVDYVRVFQRVGDVNSGGNVIDFEDSPDTYDFGMDGGFGGGAAEVIANPVQEGINVSSQVGRMLKFAGEPFAGSRLELATPTAVDGGIFTMKVWSPRPVAVTFKLEGASEAEVVSSHGGTGWEDLSFSFTNYTDTVAGIALIFDNGTVGDAMGNPDDWTFYFDDIGFPSGEITPVAFSTDFEDAPDSYFFGTDGGFGGGAAAVVANPFPQGINTSAQVGRMIKFPGDVFGGALFELPAPITVESGTSFTMKVYSPRAVDVLFKLEGEDIPPPGPEINLRHGGTGWEEMTFDFGTFSGVAQGITLIFDLGIVGAGDSDPDNWTFYFDDITQVPPMDIEPPPPPALDQIDLPITFEELTVDYTVIDFGDPVTNVTTLIVDPEDGTNTVAQTVKPVGTPVWSGTTMSTEDGFASVIPFSPTETTIGVRVYSPDAGIPVRLKAENMIGGDIAVETEVLTTVANEWETLVFDFANEVEGDALDPQASYQALSIFFNFGTDGDTAGEKTYLWDDVEFGVEAPVVDETPPTLTAVTLASDLTDPSIATVGSVITLTFTADEAINSPAVIIGGAPAETITGSGTDWVATRTLDANATEGNVGFLIAFSDLVGNAGTAVAATTDDSTVTLDLTAPTLIISGAPADFSSLDPIELTLTFSEAVTGLTAADLIVTSGAASQLMTADNVIYTVNVTPDGLADLTVAVPAGAAVDGAGNVSLAVAPITITNVLDADAPILTTVSISSSNTLGDVATTGDVVTLNMVASEDILAPVVAIGGLPADVVTGAGTTWQASRTMLAGDTEGAIVFVVMYEDLGGNPGPQATVTTDSSSVTFDVTGPAPTIGGLPSSIETLDSIEVSIAFGEDVSGFEASDVTVTGGAADNFVAIDTANYSFTAVPDGSANLTVTIAADAAIDVVGNGSLAASETSVLDLLPVWTLVWSDEFDGTEIDANTWNVRAGMDCPPPCEGVQTLSTEDAFIADGVLTLRARNVFGQYTGGLVDTAGLQELTYGRVEIDAQVSGNDGLRPSLRLLPAAETYGAWPQSGQIDVMAAPNFGVNGNNLLQHSLRYGLAMPEDTTTTGEAAATTAADANFLTYAIEWEAGEIRWFVDDVHVFTQTQDNWYAYLEDADGVLMPSTGAEPFDQAFYVALGIAVDESVANTAQFPRTLQIDAVRVYECMFATDADAGTGCSTGDNITPLSAPSEPYSEMLEVYTDAPAALMFTNDDGASVTNTLVPGVAGIPDASVVTQNEIAQDDGGNTLWRVSVAAAGAGEQGEIFLSTEDLAGNTNFDSGFVLLGGDAAGELLFDLRVTASTAGTVLAARLDSPNDNGGRVALELPTDSEWRTYSVKIADLVANPVGSGLELTDIEDLFVLEASAGTADFDVDNIRVKVACREEGNCAATSRGAPPEYQQDFEGLVQDEPTALQNDGYLVFANVFNQAGTLQYNYGSFVAPNGGPGFSGIALEQGGDEQGDQVLVIYSDYNNADHGNPDRRIEANVFRERDLTEDDIGQRLVFSVDAKRGNINDVTDAGCPCVSAAKMFIKVLAPASGFATVLNSEIVLEDPAQNIAMDPNWLRYTISIDVTDLEVGEGQILQYGFQNFAQEFQPSGVFYDNIELQAEPTPAQ